MHIFFLEKYVHFCYTAFVLVRSFETNGAKSFCEVNGSLKAPREYKTIAGHKLNPWLYRMKRERDRLSTDQIAALTAN